MKDMNKMTNAERIEYVSARILDAQKERAEAEREANDHEEEARKSRRLMADLKREIAELTAVLGHARVARNVADAEADARKAKAEAEASRERAKEMERELAQLIEQAKAKVA